MPGDHERQLFIFLCIYAAWHNLFCIFTNRADSNIFQKQRSNPNWKNCIPDHRSKLYTGGIFFNDTRIFSGNRKWESKPFIVGNAPDPLSDSDFLGVISDRAFLYLVRISNLRGNRGSSWNDVIPENNCS